MDSASATVTIVANMCVGGQLRGDLRTSCVFVMPDGEVRFVCVDIASATNLTVACLCS
jgi:hypothetical protein